MEAGDDGKLLHGQLFRGFLITMATATLDFGAAAQMLRPCEPTRWKESEEAREAGEECSHGNDSKNMRCNLWSNDEFVYLKKKKVTFAYRSTVAWASGEK